jgi:dihydrofolate reductase
VDLCAAPTLVRSLLQADLLDELTVMIHPVVVGRGKRLFEGENALKRLKLVANKTTGSGVSFLTYHPAEQK